MRYRFTDGKVIEASSPEEFLSKMRNSSYALSENDVQFMEDCAERGLKMGLDINTESPYQFLISLIRNKIVYREYSNPGAN